MVTAAELLAAAAGMEGKFSQAFPFFGSEKRGPPVVSFCRISDKPIESYEQVYEPDIVLVADPSVLASVDVASGLKKGGIIIANFSGSLAGLKLGSAKVYTVDGTDIAMKHLKKPLLNTVMLGALIKVTGIVKMESVMEAIREEFSAKSPAIAQKNIEVVQECYDLTKKDQ